jgi:hypothetical protein
MSARNDSEARLPPSWKANMTGKFDFKFVANQQRPATLTSGIRQFGFDVLSGQKVRRARYFGTQAIGLTFTNREHMIQMTAG